MSGVVEYYFPVIWITVTFSMILKMQITSDCDDKWSLFFYLLFCNISENFLEIREQNNSFTLQAVSWSRIFSIPSFALSFLIIGSFPMNYLLLFYQVWILLRVSDQGILVILLSLSIPDMIQNCVDLGCFPSHLMLIHDNTQNKKINFFLQQEALQWIMQKILFPLLLPFCKEALIFLNFCSPWKFLLDFFAKFVPFSAELIKCNRLKGECAALSFLKRSEIWSFLWGRTKENQNLK